MVMIRNTMSEAEAAVELHMSVRTLQRRRAAGKIDFEIVGKRTIKYRREHLLAYLASEQ